MRKVFNAYVPPRSLAVIVIAAIIVASIVGGIAIDRVFLQTRAPTMLADTGFHPLSSALRSPTPEERRRIRNELARELNLTPAQDSAIDAIMMQRASEFSALREEIRPRVERLVSDVRSDMEQVLTPAQREKYRRLQLRGDDARRMSSTP